MSATTAHAEYRPMRPRREPMPVTIRHSGGFTLFEILVALLIIGLIVGVATLSISNPAPGKLREESRRMEAVIGLAREEAILQSRDFGVSFWQQGYAFHEFFEGKWLRVEKDRTLRTYQLPEGMRLQLELEGFDVVMSPIEPEKPQVFVLSSGEMSPFSVRLKFLELPAFFTELSADALGTLEQTDSERQQDAKFKPSKET
jgi:general secretion pathway protein H